MSSCPPSHTHPFFTDPRVDTLDPRSSPSCGCSSGLGISFIPALGPANEPNGCCTAHPTSHPLHSVSAPSGAHQTWAGAAGARQTLSQSALAHGAPAPAPKGWSQGLAALPPQPPGLSLGTGPRPCCPRRPEPSPGPPARLPGPHRLRCLWAPRCPPLPWRLARIPQCPQGVARGEEKAALPQPDRTEAGEGVGPLPAGCVSAPRSAPPAPPDRAWSRQSGRQASPLQRCPCTLPPLRPGTRGSPGRPARAPCPHLPAAGQMLRARGLAPRSLSARPPRPRSPRLRGAPRPRAPRPRPEAPPHAPGRPRPQDPDWGPRAPTPSAAPVARETALRGSGARDRGTRKPDAPGLHARPGKPLHRRHSATRERLGRPEILRQPTPRPPTRATLIAGNRRSYRGAGPEAGPGGRRPSARGPMGPRLRT